MQFGSGSYGCMLELGPIPGCTWDIGTVRKWELIVWSMLELGPIPGCTWDI